MDSKNVCLLTLLDLSAAFDTLDHKILLERLENSFLMSGTVLQWFKSYLENRYVFVKIGNERSEKMLLTCGVPQGSVLGPILFTMYTKQLSEIISSHGLNYHFFADDTQLYKSAVFEDIHVLIDTISNCITDIKMWMDCNKLKLNEDKTEVYYFIITTVLRTSIKSK